MRLLMLPTRKKERERERERESKSNDLPVTKSFSKVDAYSNFALIVRSRCLYCEIDEIGLADFRSNV